MAQVTSGRCLCGKVSLRGHGDHKITVCHCQQCRRWSGGVGIGVMFDGGITVDGFEQLQWFESSDWAERGFCRTCGSSFLYRMKSDPETYYPQAGAFDLPDEPGIQEHIFFDSKPGYYEFGDDCPRLTGAETFAKYQSEQESGQ